MGNKTNALDYLKQNIFKHPLTFIVGALMAAVLLGYIFGSQHEFSDVENRYLTLRPSVSLDSVADGSFMSTFETYTDEQMPLRSMLVKIKNDVDSIILKQENHDIAKGHDDYLFDKSTADLTNYESNLAIIDKFIKNSDREVYVAFAPTSTLVNSDRLPLGMPVLDEAQMNEYASLIFSVDPNAEFTDIYDEMLSHPDEELYYRTDHHWNSLGAYYAYRKIIEMMDRDEAVDITSLKKNTATDFYGTFYAKYQAPWTDGDTIEYYDVPITSYEADGEIYDSLYDESKLEKYDKYAMFMYGNFGNATVHSDLASNDRTLIIFKDSYANCLIPFLCRNYDTIEIADLRYMAGSVAEFTDKYPDADILMMYNYSFLNEDKHFYKLLK